MSEFKEDINQDFKTFFEYVTPLLQKEIQYQLLEKNGNQMVPHDSCNPRLYTQVGDSESITANFRSKVMMELGDFTISSN